MTQVVNLCSALSCTLTTLTRGSREATEVDLEDGILNSQKVARLAYTTRRRGMNLRCYVIIKKPGRQSNQVVMENDYSKDASATRKVESRNSQPYESMERKS